MTTGERSVDVRYAWLTSASDEYAVRLFDSARNAPNAKLTVVASEAGPFVDGVRSCCAKLSARFIELPEKDVQWEKLIGELVDADIRFAFFVGYMKRVPERVTRRLMCLNLHPAPPFGPVGKWQDVTWGLIATEASQTGCTIHIMTKEMDRGPLISYCIVPIRGSHFNPLWDDISAKAGREGGLAPVAIKEGESEALFDAIRSEQFACEIPLMTLTLRLLARPDVSLEAAGVRIAGMLHTAGVCLTDQVLGLKTGIMHDSSLPKE